MYSKEVYPLATECKLGFLKTSLFMFLSLLIDLLPRNCFTLYLECFRPKCLSGLMRHFWEFYLLPDSEKHVQGYINCSKGTDLLRKKIKGKNYVTVFVGMS